MKIFLESRKDTADFLHGHSQFICMACIANASQYFEPVLHLFKDIISTDNAIHGNNLGL